MAKKMKKLMSMVLVLCMMVSMLSVGAFAADGTVVETEAVEGGTIVTTTTTTTDENGNTTINVTIQKDTTVLEEGDVAPEVTVPVVPNGESSASATTAPETTGEMVDGVDEITTTTIKKEVTVTTGEITESTNPDQPAQGEVIEIKPVAPDEYSGKNNITDEAYVDSDNNKTNLFQQGGLYGGMEMATDRLNYLIPAVDENGNPVMDENGNPKYVFNPEVNDASNLIEGMEPEYLLVESGERSLGEKLVIKKVTYEYDENGNVKYDENGEPVYTLSNYDSPQHVAQMILWGNDGQAYYAYSVASSDEALLMPLITGYDAKELSRSEQFKDDPEAQSHVRGIVTHGYWGTANEQDENGEHKTGSLAKIKAEMAEAVKNGMKLELNGSTDVDEILAAIENLGEGDALVATQAALWTYTHGGIDGENTKVFTGEFSGDKNGYTGLIYQYLLTVSEQEEEMVAIDKEQLDLVVGDKVGEKENGNGVYNASLNFSLTVVPGENDELCVVLKYVDADGNLQEIKKVLGEELVANADESYTLSGLKLSEKQDIAFDLRLEGIQYLENAVFVHTATHSNVYKEAGEIGARYSTLVSTGEASAAVNNGIHFTMNFTVDEEKHVVIERVWNEEATPENPGVFAVAVHRPLENIPEEEVPLADAPQTGDEAIVFAALTLLAGMSLMAMHVSEKKRKEEV